MAAGLKSLIKMNKHELDRKRRDLALLYDAQDKLIAEQNRIESEFEREKSGLAASNEIGFTFANYVEAVNEKLRINAEQQADMQCNIEKAKDSMMETFSELKKYEMTQAERERKEADEQKRKETLDLDEVAMQGYLNKSKDAAEG